RRRDVEATGTELAGARRQSADYAESSGIADGHARLGDGVEWPDGVAATPADYAETLLRQAREIADRRRDQLDAVRLRLRELEAAERRRSDARARRDTCADAFDAAAEAVKECDERFRRTSAEALEAWRGHANSLAVLAPSEPEGLLADVEVWLGNLDGPNPLRAALQAAREALERKLAAREAALATEGERLGAEAGQLRTEKAELERGADRPPPVPYTRTVEARVGRAGAPLWKVIDFGPEVDDAERAGLEAALEAAGLLDAWLLPDGVLVDAHTHDVLLVPRAACSSSLAGRLLPSIPPDVSSLAPSTVTAILRSIGFAEHEPEGAEIWVSPRGEFRVGAARGAWLKPDAEFIGHAAREAARRARLAGIGARLGELETSLANCEAKREACAATRRAAHEELATAPPDEPLLRADAGRTAAEQQRRSAQTRLGDAENDLSAAEREHAQARERLTHDARDLRLPSDADGIGRVERTLNDYRAAAAELTNAVRNHRRALIELSDQQHHEAQTRT
ncbi:MAG: hypothetical protein ACREGK_15110, partial [Geminicoccales bacterium]